MRIEDNRCPLGSQSFYTLDIGDVFMSRSGKDDADVYLKVDDCDGGGTNAFNISKNKLCFVTHVANCLKLNVTLTIED